ncbi:hypothetical protein [Streptomyces angustmyceticus]|uniref:hypothetical protein n=1 Tax=Streptomyces angustmyceticus TaxID=285578 RepID=UPI003D8F5FE3
MLTDPEAPASTPPTAGLLATVQVMAWIEVAVSSPLAFLLLAHPPARREKETAETIEAGMRGLADTLDLAPASAKLREIGRSVFLQGRGAVLLDVRGCDFMLRAPVGPRWAAFVALGGPVVIALGLDPLGNGTQQGVEAYLAASTRADRLLLGTPAGANPVIRLTLQEEQCPSIA